MPVNLDLVDNWRVVDHLDRENSVCFREQHRPGDTEHPFVLQPVGTKIGCGPWPLTCPPVELILKVDVATGSHVLMPERLGDTPSRNRHIRATATASSSRASSIEQLFAVHIDSRDSGSGRSHTEHPVYRL